MVSLRVVFLFSCCVLAVGAATRIEAADPPPPAGSWLTTGSVPGFRFKVRISNGARGLEGRKENACLPETLCVSGAVRSRPEVFLRIVGPKPNGLLWPTMVKFTTSAVEVWIEQTGRRGVRYYRLAGAAPETDVLPGLFDRGGFRPRGTQSLAIEVTRVDPSPPPGDFLTSPSVPGFGFKVRLGGDRLGRAEAQCIAETLCVSGAIPGRSEVFLRVVGPRPNGFQWPTFVRFSTSPIEIWVEQIGSGDLKYYRLEGVAPDGSRIDGRFDRLGFLPCTEDRCGGGAIPKNTATSRLPAVLVDPPRPPGSSRATLRLDIPGASSIQLTIQGEGCGGFSNQTVRAPFAEIQRTVSPFGRCDIVARAQVAGLTQTFRRGFEVEPAELVLPAVTVQDGYFRAGSLPAPSGSAERPVISRIDSTATLINGGSLTARLTLANPTQVGQISRVLVRVPTAAGYSGYFDAPARIEGGQLVVSLQLASDFFAPSSRHAESRFESQRLGLALPFRIEFQVADLFGRIGEVVGQLFQTQEVGSEDVQVSLSWDTPTDVDLHVVEPQPGEEIYWSNRRSFTGGELDLDSNAACRIDGVNNENITWPRGNAIEDEHIVRVDYWSNCGGQSARYTVTTNVCGETRLFRGSFSANQDDRGGAGSGIEITRFTPRCNYRVQGKATYEDRPQTASGLGAVGELPIRFARVFVVRASDRRELANGSTLQDGSFDLKFENDGTRGYYVEIRAEQDSATLRQRVENLADEVYVVKSASFDELRDPENTGVRIVARENESGPALNIFDVAANAAAFYRSIHGATPPFVRLVTEPGDDGLCEVSCFRAPDTISIQSRADDRDEYDDLVILHEYGHKWQLERSESDSPNGSHSHKSQVDPRLAWGEGSATFFANWGANTSLYLDSNSSGTARLDLESLEEVPLGTAGGTLSGSVSEGLVAGVLWDLADSTGETGDTVSAAAAVFDSAEALRRSDRSDRGVSGVDLVDWLDSWFCRDHGQRGDADEGVEGIVVGLARFPYDFPEVTACR